MNKPVAGLVMLLAGFFVNVHGQDVLPVPGAQSSFQQRLNTLATRADNPKKDPEPAFSMRYEGGPVSVFVGELKKLLKPVPNIIIAPGLEDVEVPAFDFQEVTLTELLQALNSLARQGKSGYWQLANSDKIWVFNPQPERAPVGYSMPYPVMPQQSVPVASPKQQSCRIFPVSHFNDTYKVEDITTAIQTAWGMVMGDTTASIKYHKDTELLLVMGDQEQIRIVQDVLTSLERGMRAKEAAPRLPKPENPAAEKPAAK